MRWGTGGATWWCKWWWWLGGRGMGNGVGVSEARIGPSAVDSSGVLRRGGCSFVLWRQVILEGCEPPV